MKLARITLAATAAASLLAASLVLGCDSKKSTAQTAAGSGCGAKSTGAKATTVANTNTKSGCDANAKGAKVANAKGGCCAKNAAMAKASGCGAAKATAMTAECALKPGRVTLTGTMACNHCDLKKTETCQSVIMASNGCHYALADSDSVATLRTEGKGQQVKVKGRVDENGLLAVSGFKVLGPASPNVGM